MTITSQSPKLPNLETPSPRPPRGCDSSFSRRGYGLPRVGFCPRHINVEEFAARTRWCRRYGGAFPRVHMHLVENVENKLRVDTSLIFFALPNCDKNLLKLRVEISFHKFWGTSLPTPPVASVAPSRHQQHPWSSSRHRPLAILCLKSGFNSKYYGFVFLFM
jgi:hypothetical protein